jgi:hypothetical protein
MSAKKMIQIRNVPDRLHRTLKARAAQAGATLSDYLLSELGDLAGRPTLDEVIARIRDRARTPVDVVAAVRAEREGRK